MVELHLHLTGAMAPRTCYELYLEQGIPLPKGVHSPKTMAKFLRVDPHAKDLGEVLKVFDYICKPLQRLDALRRVSYEVVKQLDDQHLEYAEIRFAPAKSCSAGLTQEEVMDAVIEGIEQGLKERPSIRIGVLLCLMRGLSEEQNRETLEIAKRRKGTIVCGLDLAGDEGKYGLKDYAHFFEEAREAGIPFTIHAGEVDRPENLKLAMELGAKRLGHATYMIHYPELMAEAKKRKVMIECCLTSNFGTKGIPSLNQHPIRKFLEAGIPVCLNTDDPTLFGTSIKREKDLAKGIYHFTDQELALMGHMAYEYRFLR